MLLRRRLLRALRSALAVTFHLGVLGAPAAHAATVDEDWMPLDAGAKWAYELHRDLTYAPEKASTTRIFQFGRAIGVAEPAPDRAPGGVLVRERTVWKPASPGAQDEVITQWTVYSFAGELRMHASGETRDDGTKSETVPLPPVRILPTTSIGESWNAGVIRNGDQRVELRGTVVGYEDLEGNPGWPGCLKVRFKGSVSGSLQVEDGAAEIESGQFDRAIWFARGIGIVRDMTTLEFDLKLPDGKRARSAQVITQRLTGYERGK